MIECRTMASAERYDAFALMRHFRDETTLGEALTLFVDRPDYGFVWLAYVDDKASACVSVSLSIDTETGGVVAMLRDLFVLPEARRRGLGSALLVTLEGRLNHLEVKRIVAVGGKDPSMRPFFEARGYRHDGTLFTSGRQRPGERQ
jgi:GNAT superfamily N-acetyltransferase